MAEVQRGRPMPWEGETDPATRSKMSARERNDPKARLAITIFSCQIMFLFFYRATGWKANSEKTKHHHNAWP